MKQFVNPSVSDWKAIQQRPTASYEEILPIVDEVFAAVQSEGDKAVRRYSNQFDNYCPDNIEVPKSTWEQAVDELPQDLKSAIDKAYSNIYSFHKAQRTPKVEVTIQKGVECWQEKRAIEKVGLYIPGGTAPLFSSVLMLAIPAQLAGCRDCTLYTSRRIRNRCSPDSLCCVFVWCDAFVSGGWDTSHRRLDLWNRKHPAGLQDIRSRKPVCYCSQTKSNTMWGGH